MALKQYESISQYLSATWETDLSRHAELWEMNGCLEKLATSILQIQRLSNQQNELLILAINNFVNSNVSDQVFLGGSIQLNRQSLLF